MLVYMLGDFHKTMKWLAFSLQVFSEIFISHLVTLQDLKSLIFGILHLCRKYQDPWEQMDNTLTRKHDYKLAICFKYF